MLSAIIFAVVPSSAVRPNAFAQQSSGSAAPESTLPDAPQAQQINPPPVNVVPQKGSGTLSGTVFDTNKEVLQGAHVTLASPAGAAIQTVDSGGDGQFAFYGLLPKAYKITVTAPGMTPYTSASITLRAGEARIVPPIYISITGVTTSVTVSGNPQELAEQQFHIAVQQRIGGVIPNFYSTYDWNAPPLQARQKINLGFRSIIDPVSFLATAGVAGAEQYRNIFPAYGGGLEGYGKRYGAALANHVSSTMLGRAVYPAIFHQDPRYFYKGKGSVGSRALYAMSAAFIARGDNGKWQPNYSRVLGNFSAAGISNLYYPASDRGASLVLVNGLAATGGDMLSNLIREFLLKRFTTHVPASADGQP